MYTLPLLTPLCLPQEVHQMPGFSLHDSWGWGGAESKAQGKEEEEKEKAGASGTQSRYLYYKKLVRGRGGKFFQVHEKAECFLAFLLGRRCHQNVKILMKALSPAERCTGRGAWNGPNGDGKNQALCKESARTSGGSQGKSSCRDPGSSK